MGLSWGYFTPISVELWDHQSHGGKDATKEEDRTSTGWTSRPLWKEWVKFIAAECGARKKLLSEALQQILDCDALKHFV